MYWLKEALKTAGIDVGSVLKLNEDTAVMLLRALRIALKANAESYPRQRPNG